MNQAEIASRRAARLGAVQALYQMEVSGASTADVIADFVAGKLPRETEATYTESEGDLELFKVLIEKAVERQATLDRAIARHLSKGWRLDRLDAVARAILRAGAAELEQQRDTPTAVVINEYVDIAKSFFEGPEPGFINAALDAAARDLRSGEQGA
ncbi:transcription antitermination factor NusB [Terricaulis silvestris]|uniref:Transcription antitermination protein NusB n=1 Tax=Terricaulis silvestris TaxID=2686094 RepID=A0A6I6MR77_9CAUL|nr:transcription antitermination factor NusB [Terricaulis silvestris]QGZ95287.1 N utilization substance protein B [Terricaulis silvestris]